MTLEDFLLAWLAGMYGSHPNSPLAPWRDPVNELCLGRDPTKCGHVSCAQREAIIEYALAWEDLNGARIPW